MDSHPGNADSASRADLRSPAGCDSFRAALNDYFLGVTGDATAAVEGHAAVCPACAEFLARARELSCRDFVAFLDDYIEDGLTTERRAVFERHLALCDDCVRYLESYRTTIALARVAFADPDWELAPRVPAELLDAIRRSASG